MSGARDRAIALRLSLTVGAFAVVALLLAAPLFLLNAGPSPSQGSGGVQTSAAPAIASQSPSGAAGLTREQAIQIASGFVQPGSPVMSADSGRYGVLVQGGAAAPNTMVWVIRYLVAVPYCLPGPSPEPSPCTTPAPAEWTVVLDYISGARITSGGGPNN